MNLSHWIDRQAGFTPDKPAIRFEGREITYAALAARIEAAAWALKHELGVLAGDRVAHLGHNSPEMLILLFACARMGAIFVPLNWRLVPPEHAFILGHSGASVLIADSEFVGHVEEIGTIVHGMPLACIGAPPDGWQDWNVLIDSAQSHDESVGTYDDPVLLVYTSGTTGRPKGALLTQSNLFWNSVNSTHMHDMTSSDHVLTTIPLFHVGGMNIQTLPCLHAGGTVTLHARFDPAETLSAIAEDRPSLTVLVPAQMSALMSLPDWHTADLSALRFVTTGSMIVPVSLIEKFHERGLPMVQIYGSTETAPVVVYQTRADAERKLGSTGRAGLHSEIRLVDKQFNDVSAGTRGEILIRGPQVMREYWGDPRATAEALRDGWYYSGDSRRAQEGRNHFRRREHLSGRTGGNAGRMRGNRRGRRGRPPRRTVGRNPRRHHRAARGRRHGSRRSPGPVRWPHRPLQAPQRRAVHERPAAQRHGQDSEVPPAGNSRRSRREFVYLRFMQLA
jgi:fatty-acyl-CoA synthase